MCYIFELLVVHKIQPSVNTILSNEQYGFKPGQCTTINLIVFNNFFLNAIKDYSQVDVNYVMFTDFVKTFDQVDYHVLMDIMYIKSSSTQR